MAAVGAVRAVRVLEEAVVVNAVFSRAPWQV